MEASCTDPFNQSQNWVYFDDSHENNRLSQTHRTCVRTSHFNSKKPPTVLFLFKWRRCGLDVPLSIPWFDAIRRVIFETAVDAPRIRVVNSCLFRVACFAELPVWSVRRRLIACFGLPVSPNCPLGLSVDSWLPVSSCLFRIFACLAGARARFNK